MAVLKLVHCPLTLYSMVRGQLSNWEKAGVAPSDFLGEEGRGGSCPLALSGLSHMMSSELCPPSVAKIADL